MRKQWAWQIVTEDETLYAPSKREAERWAEGEYPVKRVLVLSSKPLKKWTLRFNR